MEQNDVAVVRRIVTQVFAVQVLRSDASTLRLRVFDRVAGGEVVQRNWFDPCAVRAAVVGVDAEGLERLWNGHEASASSFQRELEPQLEDLFGQAQRLTAAFDKTRRAVKDGLAGLQPEGAEGKSANPDWSH